LKDQLETNRNYKFISFIELETFKESFPEFKKFNDSMIQKQEHGWSGAGHYFTTNKESANLYSDIGDGSNRFTKNLANTSLWAAAALASFAYAIEETTDDELSGKSAAAIIKAENAIAYADIYTFDRITGLYKEFDSDLTTVRYAYTSAVALLAMAIMFNEYQNNLSKKTRLIATHFNQGKAIQCNDRNITHKLYTLSVGTYTFIGKENTPNAEEMISISDCE
jgi:hypothetical protein